MRAQKRVWNAEPVMLVTAPSMTVGSGDDTSLDRIHLDVAETGHPTPLVNNERRAIPTFPQRPAALVSIVEVPNVPTPEPLHRSWQGVFVVCGDEGVIVVVHQDVPVDLHVTAMCCSTEQYQKHHAIRIVEENVGPIVSSVPHMVAEARNEHS